MYPGSDIAFVLAVTVFTPVLLSLKGARLTAYEFVSEGLPGTLIPDSAASFLMAQGKSNASLGSGKGGWGAGAGGESGTKTLTKVAT